MAPIARILIGSLVAATGMIGAASATPTVLSFGVTGLGNYTVDTVNIMAITSLKNLPAIELISGSTTPAAAAAAGLVTGQVATFSTLTLDTTVGPDKFTLSAGDLVLSFTNVSSAIEVASGLNSNGSISEQFNGMVTGDSSVGQIFLGQSASISETCTQSETGASITCSDSVITPGLPVPEPVSLSILGVGIFALGLARRRHI